MPDGEPGELFSSSPYQFDGYWHLPEKAAKAMHGDYLSVGDIALRTPFRCSTGGGRTCGLVR